jgi:hypothetical protein
MCESMRKGRAAQKRRFPGKRESNEVSDMSYLGKNAVAGLVVLSEDERQVAGCRRSKSLVRQMRPWIWLQKCRLLTEWPPDMETVVVEMDRKARLIRGRCG